jgi:HAD superfamily hydrolase (TIGR01662 family)
VKGAVFDLDETLIDRKGSLEVYGRRLYRDLAAARVSEDAFMHAFHQLDGEGRVPRDVFFAGLARELFEANAWIEPLVFPGVAGMLRKLREQGWRLGIVTNGGALSQGSKIANSGLAERVDAYVISAELGARKPAPEIFAHICQRIAIDPRRSWFIGDDPRSDVWGARQFGFRTCWIERRLQWPEDLAPCYDARVTAVIDCIEVIAAGR